MLWAIRYMKLEGTCDRIKSQWVSSQARDLTDQWSDSHCQWSTFFFFFFWQTHHTKEALVNSLVCSISSMYFHHKYKIEGDRPLLIWMHPSHPFNFWHLMLRRQGRGRENVEPDPRLLVVERNRPFPSESSPLSATHRYPHFIIIWTDTTQLEKAKGKK